MFQQFRIQTLRVFIFPFIFELKMNLFFEQKGEKQRASHPSTYRVVKCETGPSRIVVRRSIPQLEFRLIGWKCRATRGSKLEV